MPNEINFDVDIASIGKFLSDKFKTPISSLDETDLLSCEKSELVEYIKVLRKELILLKNEYNRLDKSYIEEFDKLNKSIMKIWLKL